MKIETIEKKIRIFNKLGLDLIVNHGKSTIFL